MTGSFSKISVNNLAHLFKSLLSFDASSLSESEEPEYNEYLGLAQEGALGFTPGFVIFDVFCCLLEVGGAVRFFVVLEVWKYRMEIN